MEESVYLLTRRQRHYLQTVQKVRALN